MFGRTLLVEPVWTHGYRIELQGALEQSEVTAIAAAGGFTEIGK